MRALLALFLLSAGSWTPERQSQLVECADKIYYGQISGYPSFHYPFSNIKEHRLKEHRQETVPLFSYGSLINLASACKILSKESLETRKPAIAFGVRRIFNYDPTKTNLGPPKDPQYRAMLNLEKTGDPKDLANGVVLDVPRESLADLCEREVGYDLVPVLYTLWVEALEVEPDACPEFRVAYTFLAPEHEREGEVRVNPNIQPRPDYYRLVREGATEYGPEYLQLFLDTTYSADGKPVDDQKLLKR